MLKGHFKIMKMSLANDGLEVEFAPVHSAANSVWSLPAARDPGRATGPTGLIRLTISNPEIIAQLKIGCIYPLIFGPAME